MDGWSHTQVIHTKEGKSALRLGFVKRATVQILLAGEVRRTLDLFVSDKIDFLMKVCCSRKKHEQICRQSLINNALNIETK